MCRRSKCGSGFTQQARLDEHGQCGSGLARECSVSDCTCGIDSPPSRASPLPQRLGLHSKLRWMNTVNVGAGLPANAVCRIAHVALIHRHRGQARLPQRLGLHSKLGWMNTVNVGAGLPANAVCQFAYSALTQRHRGQARSHLLKCSAPGSGCTRSHVGAGLPAKASTGYT